MIPASSGVDTALECNILAVAMKNQHRSPFPLTRSEAAYRAETSRGLAGATIKTRHLLFPAALHAIAILLSM
jgi:hypothetical protein